MKNKIPHWLRGGAIGLLLLLSLFLFANMSGLGFFIFIDFTKFVFGHISMDLFTDPSGGFFGFDAPNTFGWTYLSFLFFLAGSFVGSFSDIQKRGAIVPSIFIIIFGLLFIVYFLGSQLISSPFWCNLKFDGERYQPKSECLLNYIATIPTFADLSFCDQINKDNKSECYSTIAKNTSDPKYCDYITDYSWKRELCYRVGKNFNDISACGSKSAEFNDMCLRLVAFSQNDHSICEQINSTKERDDCYIHFVFENYNSNLCEKITDTETKADCKRYSEYDDSSITLSIPGNYTHKIEYNKYRNPNCPSEVNIFLRNDREHGTFIGKVFACTDNVIKGNGLYMGGDKMKTLIPAKNKLLGEYDYTVFESDDKQRRIYSIRLENIAISALIDYSYHHSEIPQNILLDFENFVSKIQIKNESGKTDLMRGNWHFDENYQISPDNQNYYVRESIDDENIKLSFNAKLFDIVRNKSHEDEACIGRYEINPADKNTLPEGYHEAEIFVKNDPYNKILDTIEKNENDTWQSGETTITKVQKIKLGEYKYIKTIYKDKIVYQTLLNKVRISILLDFRYLSQTEKNIQKIEDLLIDVQYKF